MAFDDTSGAQLAFLRTELLNDPVALGYGAFTQRTEPTADGPMTFYVGAKTDAELRAVLNAPKATAGNWADGKFGAFKRADVMGNEIAEAINSNDFAANLNPAHVMLVQVAIGSRAPLRFTNEDGSATKVLGNIRRLLVSDDATHTSRAALDALATRPGTRAEGIFGIGTTLTDLDVARALGRG